MRTVHQNQLHDGSAIQADSLIQQFLNSETEAQCREALQTATHLTKAWLSKLAARERTLKGNLFIERIISQYHRIKLQNVFDCHAFPIRLKGVKLDRTILALADSISKSASKLSVTEASYYLGNLYTLTLEENERSNKGAFYTPPNIAIEIINKIPSKEQGLRNMKCLDPACGSGVFLVAIIEHLSSSMKISGNAFLNLVESNIIGWEIDPVAVWMSNVFVSCATSHQQIAANREINLVVEQCDSLVTALTHTCEYDLIIGNPPYGKVKLPEALRNAYKRSLFGHANLYGLFWDLALQLVKKEGIIAFITPTSFMAGEYFKALRELYSQETTPVSFDFISTRKGVFQDVLQETAISVFRKGKSGSAKCKVSELDCFLNEEFQLTFHVHSLGNISSKNWNSSPWIIPRNSMQAKLLKTIQKGLSNLPQWGFEVKTGPLVWNRHKNQLRQMTGESCLPLIWAESILSNGEFNLLPSKKHHAPFIEIYPNQHFLTTKTKCILLQRTTAKEQARRLQSCILPEKFAKRGVVIENHVNIIHPLEPKIELEILDRILKSDVVDQLFRTISGSVAVSAYELETIPLPPVQIVRKFRSKILNAQSTDQLNTIVKRLYSL